MSLHEKLMNIQNSLKAPKSQYNSFGKYSYRNCEDILEAVKPLLFEQKLTLNLSDKILLIGNRYYVESTVTLSDVETGEVIVSTGQAREEETKKGMDGSQITGAASSYARKYALNGLFCIDDNKDSDSTNTQGKEDKKKNKSLTDAQIKRVYAIAYAAGVSKEQVDKQVMTRFKKKVEDLLKEEYDTVCKGYENMKGKVK